MNVKYVILPREGIRRVMRGEADLLYVNDPVPAGSTVALKVSRSRRPTCLLRVLECNPADDGFELYVRIQPHEHEPRLLAADSSKGYTDKPYLALKGELEAVDDSTLEWITARAHHRYSKIAREREAAARQARRLLSVEERLTAGRLAAKANYLDPAMVRSETKAVRHLERMGRPVEVVIRRLESFERIAYRERSSAS